MSRHASELCTLLVDETYGQLTSHIYRALLAHGRSSIGALQYRTSLSPRQIKHGLSVLVQQHLVFWYTAPHDDSTFYEANISSGYNLIRSGKYIKITEDRLNTFSASVVSHILLLGHAQVSDLVQAYELGFTKDVKGQSAAAPGLPNKLLPERRVENGVNHRDETVSLEKINQTLSDLLQLGLIYKVQESHFRSDADNRAEAQRAVPPVEEYIARNKKEREALWEQDVENKLEEWRYGTREEIAAIEGLKRGRKRPLEDEDDFQAEKRRRLYLPMSNEVIATADDTSGPKIADSGYLRGDLALRINHEKFAVLIRSAHLVELVDQAIGTQTSSVYEMVLRAIEPKVRACQEGREETDEEDEVDLSSLPKVSTQELVARIPDTPEMSSALGQADTARLGNGEVEHPKKRRRKHRDQEDEALAIGPASSDEEDDDEDDNISDVSSSADSVHGKADYYPNHNRTQAPPPVQSTTPHHATVRAHLILLSQHSTKFLIHIPRTPNAPECWTVNFPPLLRTLRTQTLLNTITTRHGAPSARLTRILSEKGKLDEKTLCSLSLLPQKDLRSRLAALQTIGLVELQEVPRDNARVASRTNFLYSFEEERASTKVLEECYKCLARCLQRVGVERDKVSALLEKAGRSDVRGREEELLGEGERKALKRWRGTEERIWGEVGRLDGLVGVLRDF